MVLISRPAPATSRFDDVDLVDLAQRLPTPFIVYSAGRIAENVATLRDAFQTRHPKTEVFFASKACSALWVLEQVREAGINVEVNSGGELWKALRAGFAGEQVVFNGVVQVEVRDRAGGDGRHPRHRGRLVP